MIGCHWEFSEGSEKYYVSVGELTDITIFLEKLRTNLQTWVRSKKKQVSNPNTFVSWRETWHPDNVQVWGRIANNKFDSKAVGWFHSNYSGVQTIKKTLLTGQLNQIGRIWHRMYPRYIKASDNTWQPTGEYIELLTIFPNILDKDESQNAEDFLTFLDTKTSFSLLYPG
jgi:CRISPR-associated protein Cmr6